MTTSELNQQIKACHPDHRNGNHSLVGKLHVLLAAKRGKRCPVCGEPMPLGSKSQYQQRVTCGFMCGLKRQYQRRANKRQMTYG